MKLTKTFDMSDMPPNIQSIWTDWAMDYGNRGYVSVAVDDDMRFEFDFMANEYVTSKYAPLADWLIEQGAEEDEHILVEYDW